MEIEYIAAIAIACLALIGGLVQAAQRIQGAQARIAKVLNTRTMQVQRLRKAARNSLYLARDIRNTARRRDQLEEEVAELKARLDTASKVDHRLYVLDDRRTRSDLNWIVIISNPNYATAVNTQATPEAISAWRTGRRLLVWALDAAKAREKTVARFPDRLGYRIVSITEQNAGE